MRTFKICPPEGLWYGSAADDGGNDTYFTTNVQNITTLNRGCLSLDYYFYGSQLYWLDMIGYPILLGLCIIGNILNLMVFASENPNSSKNIYLSVISVANFIYMWSQLPFYFHNAVADIRRNDSFATFFWHSEGIWKFLIDAFVTTSDWLLVMFSVERLVAICAPRQYTHRNHGVGKALFCSFAVFVGACFYSLYNLLGYYWFYYHFSPTDAITAPVPPALRIWRHMQQLAIVCVPIGTYGLILLINTIVILFVLKRRKEYPTPLSVSRNSNSGDLLRLLIASFVLYLVCVLPMFDLDILTLLNMYHLYDMPVMSQMYQVWYPIALYILNINYSVTFFVYLLASPSFRRTLKRIFCCTKLRKHGFRGSRYPILAYPDRDRDSPGSDDFLRRNGGYKASVDGIRL